MKTGRLETDEHGVLGSKPRPPVNGNKTPEEIAVETAVQHHVASYQKLVSENTALRERLDKMEQLLTINKIEIEGLRAEKGAAESRVTSYQIERDEAVRVTAKMYAVIENIFTIASAATKSK